MKIIEIVNEERERYRGVLQPGRSRFDQLITLQKPIVAYHATHEEVGLILQNREIKNYNSMGTWLSSNQAMATKMYGPHSQAYQIPPGQYLLAKRHQELWDLMLNCLPIIEQVIGPAAANHLMHYPLNGKNLQWMRDIRLRTKAKYEQSKQAGHTRDTLDSYIPQVYRYSEPKTAGLFKKLLQSSDYYHEVAKSAQYSQQYRTLLVKAGIQGIIWNARNWDGSPERQTIFLIFNERALHPYE